MPKSELRKLILAKSIFLHGCTHANARDEVSRILAIHHFDFAVEMILKCLAVKYNIVFSSRQEFRFKDLWNEIDQQNINLPLKSRIFELHDVRNLVQHAGIIPSFEDVIMFKGYVETFLEDVIKRAFGISFDELTLAQLIENVKLRKIVQKAEELFREGKYKECILACDEALIKATFDIADIFSKAGMLTGYWGAGNELKNVINKDYAEKYRGKEFYTLARDLSKAILQIGQATTCMQFLDEHRAKFLKFRELVSTLEEIPAEELKEKARFSLNFVIELILKWQEEDMLHSSSKGGSS